MELSSNTKLSTLSDDIEKEGNLVIKLLVNKSYDSWLSSIKSQACSRVPFSYIYFYMFACFFPYKYMFIISRIKLSALILCTKYADFLKILLLFSLVIIKIFLLYI